MKRTTYIFIGLLVSGLIVIVATIIFIFMSGKPYQEDGAFLGNEQVKMDLNGIEKARFIERSGPDLITGGDWHFMLAAKIYKGDFLIKKIGLSLNIKVILTIGEDDWFRRKDGTSIVDDNPRLQRTDQIGVIVTATQIVDIPAIWHGRSIHP